MDCFEARLEEIYSQVERYVKYRLNGSSDAEDILQEVCLTAYLKYDQLQKKESFKAWVLSIARNRCSDYFRRKSISREIPLEDIPESKLVYGRRGWMISTPVEDTLALLTDSDREVLCLFYWRQLPIAQISQRLGIPQ